MEFKMSEEQELILKNVRELCEEYLAPARVMDLDQKGECPMDFVNKLAELDFFGLSYPTEWGGSGMDYLTYIMVVEEIAKYDPGVSIIYSAHCSLGAMPIVMWGTEAAKKKYLPRLCKGEIFGAFALTEPGAGTDAAAGKSLAVKQADGSYLLNGTKCFITNGDCAHTFIFPALMDPSIGTKSMTAFIIDKDMPGLEIGKHENKMGIRTSHTTEVICKNVVVPAENLLWKEGKGFPLSMMTLDGGRIGVAAQALGTAEAALREGVKFANERVQFGKPIATKQAIQWMIAECATDIEAARWLVYRAAVAHDEGRPYSKEAAMAKMFASETAVKVCDKMLQVHGGYGYIKDFMIEKLYRDAKITTIYEGTNEVQRMVVSGNVIAGK